MSRPQSMKKSVPILWRVLRYLWPTVKRERPLIAGSMSALLAASLLRLLEPWPLKFVFDRIISTEDAAAGRGLGFIGDLSPMALLLIAAVAVVAITGLRAAMEYFQSVGFAIIGNRTLISLREKLYRHVQRLSLQFHSQARSGDLIARVTTDMSMLKDAAVTAVLPLVARALTVACMVLVMFLMEWRLALIAVGIAPLFWLITVGQGRRVHQAARKQRKCDGALTATVAESLSGVRVVQALSLEEVFARDFANRNKKSLKEGVKTSRMSARLERYVDVIIGVGTAAVLLGGGRLVVTGVISPGDLLVFLYYLKHTLRPARDFAKYTARLAKAAAAGERVLELMERVPDVDDLPDACDAPAFRGTVRFENVSFAYDSACPILKNISFEVRPGQTVALVGPSGIGKSTLVSLVLRLYDPVEGKVTVDGEDVRRYTLASLRSQISVVMQDSILFAGSVADNIAYTVPDATREQIEEAAEIANADCFIRGFPEGFDTMVGERGETLSYGQRQRMAIARAAIRKSPILILDEPLSGLDEDNELLVAVALARLSADRTTFLITHDVQAASAADRILYLQDGRLAEFGTHAELMSADGPYARLYRLQTGNSRTESDHPLASASQL